ncbi:MAG: cation:proton antiporter [Oligoflexia bacterium]|nr:cation:proton antiporter [Oligoflexia bacterium]
MHLHLLEELTVVFALSIGVLVLCYRLRVPAIVGFLVTGVLAGPNALGLVSSLEEIEALAEVGIALLLFSIGVEFSLQNLLQIKQWVLVAGSVQLALTLSVTAGLSSWFGFTVGESVLLGALISLSSTALILKLLQDRAEIDSIYGRVSFSVLIFQDLAVIPLMLLVPFLSANSQVTWIDGSLMLLKGLCVLALVSIAAKWIVPRVLNLVAATKSRELFLFAVVAICFSVAFLTQKAGLSLALGALLAGLIISESQYSHQALGNIIPFQQLFTTVFFISVGMLLDPLFVLRNIEGILPLALFVVVLKALLAAPAALAMGLSLRTAILSGLALAQVGEFSFVLAREGVKHGVLQSELYQGFLAVSVLTIALTPLLLAIGPRVADAICSLPLSNSLKVGWRRAEDTKHLMGHAALKDHVLCVGYGVSGEAVLHAAKMANIPAVALDMNPEIVRKARANGDLVVYGDATQEAVLHEEGIETAKVIFVAISDPFGTRRVVSLARTLNPKAYIIVRTRLIDEIQELYKLGAQEVIADEFESAVESLSRVMRRYLVPRAELDTFTEEFRARGYEMIRTHQQHSPKLHELTDLVPEVDLFSLRVSAGSKAEGKTLSDLALRAKFGVTILAIRRKHETLVNPAGTTAIQAEDVVVLLGPANDLAELEATFGEPKLEA